MNPLANLVDNKYATVLGLFLVAGLVFILFGPIERSGAAFLWALAYFALSFFVGFLFGFPRSNESAATGEQSLLVNNNLWEVSEWVTKTIVGVSLTQLQQFPENLQKLSWWMATGLASGSQTFELHRQYSAAIVIYFSALGLLGGYLVTRNYLSGLFARADRDLRLALASVPPPAPGGDSAPAPAAAVTAAQKQAIDSVASRKLEDLPQDAEMVAAWSRAALDAKEFAKAEEGYRKAVTLDPTSARARYSLAMAIARADSHGRRREVLENLREAIRLAKGASQEDLELKDYIYNSYTYHALYLDPPEGYEMARTMAEAYMADPDKKSTGAVEFNLACSYGLEAIERRKRNESIGDLADKAFAALSRSLSIDPRWLPRAQALTEKENADNDFSPFVEDVRFRELLHLVPLVGE
ncbi:MAG: hypothetical protein SFV18_19965 [Bryobacteraceae bacterium]|nr:hypothetical protein [Bryobacteraceae bacterium]